MTHKHRAMDTSTSELRCPKCDAILIDCLGRFGEDIYEAVRCPNGCDLWEYYT